MWALILFGIVYFYLTFVWFMRYGFSRDDTPTTKTIIGLIILAWLGARAEPATALLLFPIISMLLHLNDEHWNPFHSGMVAAGGVMLFIALNVVLLGSAPLEWLEDPSNSRSAFALAIVTHLGTALITVFTGNPLRHVTVGEVHRSQKGWRPDPMTIIFRSKNKQREKEFKDRKKEETRMSSEVGDVDPEDLRPDPEHHPFKGPRKSQQQSNRELSQNNQQKPAGNSKNTNDLGIKPVDDNKSGNKAQKNTQTERATLGGENDHADDTENAGVEAHVEAEEEVEPFEGFEFPWEEPPEDRFEDIGGYDTVKDDLMEKVVKPLKDPEGDYERFDVEPARGILFHGPPGTGKTMFARALANELQLPFVELSQADLSHHHINKSPQIIKSLFEEAQEVGGVIFIDEAEQLLRDRQDKATNSHAEDQKVTNTFLTHLTKEDSNYIVILTTNQKEMIDSAMLRPGRVDEHFKIDTPDEDARTEIAKVKLVDVPHNLTERHLNALLEATDGWSGAHITYLIDQGKMEAASRGAEKMGFNDLKTAYKKLTRGEE